MKNYRKHHRKLPKTRQMLCTDIRVSAREADKAFMRVWNLLVSHGLRYAASFREMARDGKDELTRYRVGEDGQADGREGKAEGFRLGPVLKGARPY